METIKKAESLGLLFLCALCWGPSYLFIKIAVAEIPPLTLVFARVGIAALILFVVCRFQKHRLWDWKHLWKQFAVLGITLNALPFFLISFGELYISSSLAGILNGLTVLFTAFIAHYFDARDPLTKKKILGICVGLLGLGVVYLPLFFQENLKNGIGALTIIAACLSYAVGAVYARTHLGRAPSIVVLTSQLFIAALILLPFSLFIDRPFAIPLPSYSSLLSVLGLGVIGTSIAFLLYFKIIQLAGSTYASLSSLIVPILAMFFGAVFLHEHLTWNLYLGTLFILAGTVVINPALNKRTP